MPLSSSQPGIFRSSSGGGKSSFCFLVLLVLQLAAISARTQTLGSDSFSYAGGASLTGQNGGSGWLAAWASAPGSGNITVNATGLTYAGLTNTGGALVDADGSSHANGRQWFTPAVAFTNGTTIWFSGLLRYDVNNTSDILFLPFGQSNSATAGYGVAISAKPQANAASAGTNTTVYIRNNGSAYGIGGSSGPGLVAAVGLAKPVFVVGRFILSTSANSDTLDVWVNQTVAPTEDSVLRLTGFTAFRTTATSEGKLLIYTGFSAQGAVDEIAIGYSYADVTGNLATNPAPVITLTTPTNEMIFASPATVPLAATVTTNGHAIQKVQFLNGTTILNEDTTAPFTYNWPGVAASNYNVSARLVYDNGLAVQANATTIYVFDNSPVTVNVNAQSNRLAISPLIYGCNWAKSNELAELNYPLNRRGGEVESRYNWEINAHNLAKNWYFISNPDSVGGVPGADADLTVSHSFNGGADAIILVPMIGWMPKLGPNRSSTWSYSIAKYGPQTGNEPYGSQDAGNGVSAATGQNITTNDPTDASFFTNSLFQAGYIKHLTNRWGTAANGGVKYYALDNEPMLWDFVHRDVQKTNATKELIRDRIFEYGSMVKSIDPSAQILAANEWGWLDWKDYYPWLLAQCQNYHNTNGTRLLDYLTLHYYAALSGTEGSLQRTLQRNRSTRSLWDSNYTDESWINTKINLIPTMKAWVATNYPGTKIGITEYNWEGDGDIEGAVIQAEVLGIFGREGLDLATRWGSSANNPTNIIFKAMKMYRNYDGLKSTFGQTSVYAGGTNPDELATFAAERSADKALTVMVMNKQPVGNRSVTLSLANFTPNGTAEVWQLTASNVITRLADAVVSGNSLTATVPAQSITLFVLPSGIPIVAGAATNPTPVNGLGAVTLNPVLSWSPGTNAAYHFIYLGTSSNAVALATTNSPEFIGITAGTNFTPGSLAPLTTYYWRVDTKANAAATPGAVWKFTTDAQPPFAPVFVNFQPSGAATVPGYLVDGGSTYANRGNGQTYGWNVDHAGESRDRGVNADQLLDTLIHFITAGTWEIALPNGAYSVKVSVGDAGNPSTYTLNVEGVNYWNALALSANQFANQTRTVTVSDGKLTLDQGAAANKATRINYIEISAAAPSVASNPNPANGAANVATNAVLSWKAGSNVITHLVYFGTSSNAVALATTSSAEFKGSQTDTNYAPTGLALNQTYFWRVEEAGLATNAPGSVWQFATLSLTSPASNPSPANGALNVALAPTLTWTAGLNATSHHVYFGFNSNAVAVATTNAPEFKGSQAATNYAPGPLASSGRYFWRVDEVGATLAAGPVWTFATLVNSSASLSITGVFNGSFSVNLPSLPGQTYRVERTDQLSPTDWQVVSNGIPGSGAVIQISDPTATTTQRFYRAVILAP